MPLLVLEVNPYLSYLISNNNLLPVKDHCQYKKNEKCELTQFRAFIKRKGSKVIPPTFYLKVVVSAG